MHLLLREQPTRYMKTWQCDHIKRYMHLGQMSIHFWPECMLHINWKTCLRISPQHNTHMSIHQYWTPTFRQLGKASSKGLCPIIWPDCSVWEFAMMLQLPNPTLTHTNFGQTYKDHPIITHSWFNQPFPHFGEWSKSVHQHKSPLITHPTIKIQELIVQTFAYCFHSLPNNTGQNI